MTHEAGMAAAVVVAVCDARPIGRNGRRRHEKERSEGASMEAEIREILSEHARLPVDMADLATTTTCTRRA